MFIGRRFLSFNLSSLLCGRCFVLTAYIKNHLTNPNMTMNNENIQFDILNEEQVQALNMVENTNFSFFLTGRAGTGKTTFLKYIQNHVDKQFIVVAYTGSAALLAEGVTIHSFFGMPLEPIGRHTEFEINSDKRSVLRQVDTIIVDEVSMASCDLIDGIDRILRDVMRSSQPFGGKQVIFAGDLYQLEPVYDKNDAGLVQFYRDNYGTDQPYFFHAHVFSRFKLPRIEFKKVYRQSDTRFLSALDKVRMGVYSPSDLMLLNTKGVRNAQNNGDDTLMLTSRNDAADIINAERLAAIDAAEFTYLGTIEGKYNHKRLPVQQELTLKVGARVMFCRNDQYHRWVNGTTATVSALSEEVITIRLDNGSEYTIEPVSWDCIDYTYDPEKKRLTKSVVGTYTQFPVKLAWAITIHKSQGMTFDKLNIDSSKGFFVPGQLYVALSRARSWAGLGLTDRIKASDIRRKPEIDIFMRQYNSMEAIRADVSEYSAFNKALLESDYDRAALESRSLMHTALSMGNMDDAYYAAIKLMDTLYNTDILVDDGNYSLISGEDIHSLLLNVILSIENGNYSVAIALADQGILLSGEGNFFYLKSIALTRLGHLEDAAKTQDDWRASMREQNDVVDSRCRYAMALTNYELNKSYISDMQSVIRHNREYIPAIICLQRMLKSKGVLLETNAEARVLVDVFNGYEGDFPAAWRNSTLEARRVLITAIISYPYE